MAYILAKKQPPSTPTIIATILKGSTHPNITVTRNANQFSYSYSDNKLILKTTATSNSAGYFFDHDFSQYIGNGYKLVIKWRLAKEGSTITSISDTNPTNYLAAYHVYSSSDQTTDSTGRTTLWERVPSTSAYTPQNATQLVQQIINGSDYSDIQETVIPIDSLFTSYYKYLNLWSSSWDNPKIVSFAIEEMVVTS